MAAVPTFFGFDESRSLPYLLRVFGFGVFEDAAAGFSAEPSRFDVLDQERRGAVFFSEGFLEVFEDAEAGVEADEIDQFERAHWVIQS
jgi:hypothetical protein